MPDGITPEVVLVAMAGVAQLVALERALGVSGGHEQALAFVERHLDDFRRGEALEVPTGRGPRHPPGDEKLPGARDK